VSPRGIVAAGVFLVATGASLSVPCAGADDAMSPPAARAASRPAANAQPLALQKVGVDQRLGAEVPLDLVFRDETGREVTLERYFGGRGEARGGSEGPADRTDLAARPVVLVMAYYECPMLCTLVLNGLVRALRALSFDVGTEFDVLTVSFDPTETPALAAAKKAAYLEHYDREGTAAGWHFLTGERESIARLARAVGFRFTWLPDIGEFAHAAAIMVLTPDGRVARYFYGVEYPPRDLRLGLIEAADGTIGSAVDQVLLYCFRYDPATGTYGAVALNMIRLGGVVTVLALGGFVLLSRRREHADREGA